VGDGVASDVGAEEFAEVGEERAPLQRAGDRGREQPLDRLLAAVGLAAEREFAVDDGAAQAALGVVVGRLDAVDEGEGRERRPALEQVGGEQAVILRLGALARRLLEQRSEFVLERADLFDQAGAVAVLSVLVPGGERSGCDLQAGLAELFLGGEPLAVGAEVPDEVRTAELALFGVEVVAGPAAIRAGDAVEVVAE
jgi:hypothetical protein